MQGVWICLTYSQGVSFLDVDRGNPVRGKEGEGVAGGRKVEVSITLGEEVLTSEFILRKLQLVLGWLKAHRSVSGMHYC